MLLCKVILSCYASCCRDYFLSCLDIKHSELQICALHSVTYIKALLKNCYFAAPYCPVVIIAEQDSHIGCICCCFICIRCCPSAPSHVFPICIIVEHTVFDSAVPYLYFYILLCNINSFRNSSCIR